jgi:phosphate:Na+ symporter
MEADMPLRRISVLLFALLVGLAILPMPGSTWTCLTPTTAHAQASGSPLEPVSLPRPTRVPDGGSSNEPKEDAKKQDKKQDKKKPSLLTIVMGLLAGLALFLFGVEQMAQGFRAVAGDNIKTWLERFTKNRFAAVGTGAVATTVLDSSSVTIILLITLIQAGLISFSNSLGVVLGANIGTAVGSQLIAFDVHKYAPIGIAAGFLLHVAGRSDRQKEFGLILLGLGMLFFGLGYLGDAMEPFKENKAFTDWMATLGKNPLLGALAGCVFTLVIQSSSATVGVAITMAASGLIGLAVGVRQ